MKKQTNLQLLILAALFAALTAVGAFIKAPIGLVPTTLQTLFVLLSGVLLGSYYGMLSQALYVFIGLVGIPVFANGGGPQYVLQPTFGYLMGFIAGSYLAGYLTHGSGRAKDFQELMMTLKMAKVWRLALAASAGLLAIFILGVSYLYIISSVYLGSSLTLQQAIVSGFLIFLVGDIVKIAAIILFVKMFVKRFAKHIVA